MFFLPRSGFVQQSSAPDSKSLPYAFTEHGAIMAASVLNSQKAVEVSVYIVRAFLAKSARRLKATSLFDVGRSMLDVHLSKWSPTGKPVIFCEGG